MLWEDRSQLLCDIQVTNSWKKEISAWQPLSSRKVSLPPNRSLSLSLIHTFSLKRGFCLIMIIKNKCTRISMHMTKCPYTERKGWKMMHWAGRYKAWSTLLAHMKLWFLSPTPPVFLRFYLLFPTW